MVTISFFFFYLLVLLSGFTVPVFAHHIEGGSQHPMYQTATESIYEQVRLGVAPEDILCKYGLELYFKANGLPICIRESTFEKLTERGYPFSRMS